MKTAISWSCSACEEPLPGGVPPCPKCGGTARTTSIANQAQTEPVAMVRMKKRDPNFSSRKQPRVDQMVGREMRKSVGDLVSKTRRLDKEAGTYSESVTDADGNHIHQQHEPLGDHTGHGSDKKK